MLRSSYIHLINSIPSPALTRTLTCLIFFAFIIVICLSKIFKIISNKDLADTSYTLYSCLLKIMCFHFYFSNIIYMFSNGKKKKKKRRRQFDGRFKKIYDGTVYKIYTKF